MTSSLEPNAIAESSEAECVVSCSKSVAWESRKTNGVKPRIKEIAFPKIWYPIPGIWLFTFIERKEKRKKDLHKFHLQ